MILGNVQIKKKNQVYNIYLVVYSLKSVYSLIKRFNDKRKLSKFFITRFSLTRLLFYLIVLGLTFGRIYCISSCDFIVTSIKLEFPMLKHVFDKKKHVFKTIYFVKLTHINKSSLVYIKAKKSLVYIVLFVVSIFAPDCGKF